MDKGKPYFCQPQAISDEKLRQICIQTINKHGLGKIAINMGIDRGTLWNQINRRNQCIPAYIIPALVFATGDPELLDVMANSCGYVVRKANNSDPIRDTGELFTHTLDGLSAFIKNKKERTKVLNNLCRKLCDLSCKGEK